MAEKSQDVNPKYDYFGAVKSIVDAGPCSTDEVKRLHGRTPAGRLINAIIDNLNMAGAVQIITGTVLTLPEAVGLLGRLNANLFEHNLYIILGILGLMNIVLGVSTIVRSKQIADLTNETFKSIWCHLSKEQGGELDN